MNKAALIARTAEGTALSRQEAAAAVEATLRIITEAVAAGEKVSLTGFGVFFPKHRPAHSGRNPQTQEPVEIAASTVPAFRPGQAFKQRVSGARL